MVLNEAEALAVSAAIEAPIAYLIVTFMKWPSRGAVHAGVASAVATAVTHPQLWVAALWSYPRFAYWPSVILLEAVVVLVEGVLICWMAQLSLRRGMLVSLIANGASCAFGLITSG